MTPKTKLAEVLELILEESQPSDLVANVYPETPFDITNAEKTQKIMRLESLVCGLSTKVTVLTDQISELNERIVSMMTLQEELLYTFDQAESMEDNAVQFTVDFEGKKFGLN